MEKKRRMARDKLVGVVVDALVDELHTIQLNMIDEAVEKSDLSQANEIIKYIMEKK